MSQMKFMAVDLGASNGRTILGEFDGGKIELEEINRFDNNYIRVGDSYYWDILSIFSHIKEGLRQYSRTKGTLNGIGIDTWGVDFGLIDKQDRLIGNPRSYRDPRGLKGMNAFHTMYGGKTAFEITGIANLEFNSIYQLYDMVLSTDPQLDIAEELLLIPDLLGYMLCGEKSTEYTNATTMQILDSKTGNWSEKIIKMLGIKDSLFTNIQMSGERKGKTRKSLNDEIGLTIAPPVICVGSHDTASAVAAIPSDSNNYAFISSGTWSLMGICSDKPIINDYFYNNGFSNEGTVDGKYRALRNIMGLWIIQNCKSEWDRQKKTCWDDVVNMARRAQPHLSFIDVNAHDFFNGENMVKKIQEFCRKTSQIVPQTIGEIARVVYESLAMSYKETFDGLEKLNDKSIDVLHIVGGGAKNKLLNQFTANAINREVVAGPTEATAIGNLMVQVKASGEVKNSCEMTQVIRDSFDVESFEPMDIQKWANKYEVYKNVINKISHKNTN